MLWELSFSRALYVRPGRIAGLRVKPFSLFQSYALDADQSPFTQGADEVSAGACILALPVLRSSFADGISRLYRCSRSCLHRARYALAIQRTGLRKVVHQISEHIDAYSGYPETWRVPNSKAKCSGVPWQWYVASLLMQHFGIAEEHAWDMPLVAAACYKAIYDEREGGPEVISIAELQQQAAWQAAKAVTNG